MTKIEQEKTNVDNIGEAISVLVQAVHIAQAKGGVYSFSDAAKVHSALQFIQSVSKTEDIDQTGPKGQVETPEVETIKVETQQEVDATVEK